MKHTSSLLLFLGLGSSLSAGYVGFSGGYLIESEDEYVTARLGFALAGAGTPATHNIEAEVGFTSASEMGASADIIPLMVNYRYQVDASDRWTYAIGAGSGMARVSFDGFGVSDNDWGWAAQAFVSAAYRVSTAFELSAGARYIYIDEVSLLGVSFDLEDDLALELGGTFRF